MDEVQELIHELESWQRAYPLNIFPEPDMERAAEILADHGMTLDAISASNGRHVVNAIVPRVLEALTVSPEKLEAAWRAVYNEMSCDDELYPETAERYARAALMAAGMKVSE